MTEFRIPTGGGVNRDDAMVPDLTEPIQLAEILKQRGVHIISASNGIPEHNPHLLRPYDTPPKGVKPPKEHPLEWVAKVFRIVGAFQQAHPGLIVLGSAYSWLRQFFGHAASGNLKTGRVSMVGLGRIALAYPHFARDLMERGKLDPGKVCLACSRCTQLFLWGGPGGCMVRNKEIYGPIYRRRERQNREGTAG